MRVVGTRDGDAHVLAGDHPTGSEPPAFAAARRRSGAAARRVRDYLQMARISST